MSFLRPGTAALKASAKRWLPDSFIIVLLCTLCMATLLPARGLFGRWLGVLTTAAIVALFFLHGAKLSRSNVTAAVRHWRLHAAILAVSFIVFPAVGLLASIALPRALTPDLWIGVLFLCALPSTVQSSIAFTSIARGNVAGTVASAAVSNLLGIVLTPIMVSLMTRAHAAGISLSGMSSIVLEMLVPFVAGHLCRPLIGAWVERRKALLSVTDRGTVVLAVYGAFSAAVLGRLWQSLPAATVCMVCLVCVGLLGSMLWIAQAVARSLHFTRADEISVVFCGSKKSLVSGIPMARVLFDASHVGAAILPLIIYHQIQLVVCAFLARRYAAVPPDGPLLNGETRRAIESE